MTRPSATQCPSSEKTLVAARERCIRPELGELGALEALGDRADRHDVDQPGGQSEVEDPLGRLGGVGDRGGVGHGEHGGVATDGRGPRARGDRLGVLAARLAQVRVQVDEAREQGEAVGVDPLGVVSGPRRCRARRPAPSRSSTSPRRAVPSASYQVGPVRTSALTRPPPLRRGGGRARTSAPPPRPRPGRAPGSGRRPRRPR